MYKHSQEVKLIALLNSLAGGSIAGAADTAAVTLCCG
jgi:hypothetical protein